MADTRYISISVFCVAPGSSKCDLAVFPSTTTACTGTVSPLCYVHVAYHPSANPSAPPHVVLEEIYISGFLKSYNEPKEALPVGGMP
jgi:hypothetical protein